MKKIIALILAFTMMLSCTAVMAAKTPSLEFMKKSALECEVEQKGTLTFKLNEPFELLKIEEFNETLNHIDVPLLFESLFNTTYTTQSKNIVSADGNKRQFEAHLKCESAIKFNNNLETDIRAGSSFWMDVDTIKEGYPTFDFIMANPLTAKYVYANSDLMIQNGAEIDEEIYNIYKKIFDASFIPTYADKIIEAIEKHGYITGDSRKVKIVFTDMGLKMFMADVFTYCSELMDVPIDDEDLNSFFEVLKNVPFFGNEALVLEYSLDSFGRISNEKITLNVNVDWYDVIVPFSGEEELNDYGITKENSTLNFTVYSENSYKYSSVKIEKPVLTEENSVDIFEYEDPYYYDEEYEDYNDYEEYEYTDEDLYTTWVCGDIDSNCYIDGNIKYVKLRSFLEDAGYAVNYDNGVISAIFENKYSKYTKLDFVIGASIVSANNQNIPLNSVLFVKDGVTYISIDDCEKLTNYKKESVCYYFTENSGYVSFTDDSFWDKLY